MKDTEYFNTKDTGYFEDWLLNATRQFVRLLYVLGNAFWIFSGIAGIYNSSGEVVAYSLWGWIGFTIAYALIAAPVIALIRIEKNNRPEGN
jgi:hypothetical protein